MADKTANILLPSDEDDRYDDVVQQQLWVAEAKLREVIAEVRALRKIKHDRSALPSV